MGIEEFPDLEVMEQESLQSGFAGGFYVFLAVVDKQAFFRTDAGLAARFAVDFRVGLVQMEFVRAENPLEIEVFSRG